MMKSGVGDMNGVNIARSKSSEVSMYKVECTPLPGITRSFDIIENYQILIVPRMAISPFCGSFQEHTYLLYLTYI